MNLFIVYDSMILRVAYGSTCNGRKRTPCNLYLTCSLLLGLSLNVACKLLKVTHILQVSQSLSMKLFESGGMVLS